MLCLITMFSCEKTDFSESSSVNTLEQIEWEQLPEAAKKALESNDSITSSFDPERDTNQPEDNYRNCVGLHSITGTAGGAGGDKFFIYPESDCDVISVVLVRAGIYIDGILIGYKRPDGTEYFRGTGGSGGTWYFMGFSSNEFIRFIEVKIGIYVDKLRIQTNLNDCSFGGNGGHTTVKYGIGSPHRQIKGFHGNFAALIDNIGALIYYRN